MHQSDQNIDRQSVTIPHLQQPELMNDQFIQENIGNILSKRLAGQRGFNFNKINCPTLVKTEILTPAPGPVFIQKSDSRSCSAFGKNRRLLSVSTPALRLRDHLC